MLELSLQKYFGYTEFRPGQKEIVEAILAGHDTLAIMATGQGKSICFQLPSLLTDGTTVVISPLIALMNDQVEALHRKNISATSLYGDLSNEEKMDRLTRLSAGEYKMVYVAPERLLAQNFISHCQKILIPLIVIDEAHCISEWGHDFRPSYKKIPQFVKQLSTQPTIAAFTATATPTVRNEICQLLHLQNPKTFLSSYLRKNVFLTIIHCKTSTQRLLHLLLILQKHQNQAGIIYCNTRKNVESVCQILQHFGKNAVFYHGGMDARSRATVHQHFFKDEVHILVATNAYGMGIDKPNIRFVIHYNFSGSIEAYYQEAGRGGRDGNNANAYLLFVKTDIEVQEGLSKSPKKLETMLQFIKRKQCRTKQILRYFGENFTEKNCGACEVCKKMEFPLDHDQQKIYKALLQLKKAQHFGAEFSTAIIKFLTLLQPNSQEDLLKIPGIGQGWLGKYADLTLTITHLTIDTTHHL